MNAKKERGRGVVHILCNLGRYVVAFLYEWMYILVTCFVIRRTITRIHRWFTENLFKFDDVLHLLKNFKYFIRAYEV